MSLDWCGLCPFPLSEHTVMTEEIMVDGEKAIRPIGWRCPDVKEEGDVARSS